VWCARALVCVSRGVRFSAASLEAARPPGVRLDGAVLQQLDDSGVLRGREHVLVEVRPVADDVQDCRDGGLHLGLVLHPDVVVLPDQVLLDQCEQALAVERALGELLEAGQLELGQRQRGHLGGKVGLHIIYILRFFPSIFIFYF
jgi:hypothetical protein